LASSRDPSINLDGFGTSAVGFAGTPSHRELWLRLQEFVLLVSAAELNDVLADQAHYFDQEAANRLRMNHDAM